MSISSLLLTGSTHNLDRPRNAFPHTFSAQTPIFTVLRKMTASCKYSKIGAREGAPATWTDIALARSQLGFDMTCEFGERCFEGRAGAEELRSETSAGEFGVSKRLGDFYTPV